MSSFGARLFVIISVTSAVAPPIVADDSLMDSFHLLYADGSEDLPSMKDPREEEQCSFYRTSNKDKKKVFCLYKAKDERFRPFEVLDPCLCTHLIYAEATRDDSSTLNITPEKVKPIMMLRARNKKLRVLLAVDLPLPLSAVQARRLAYETFELIASENFDGVFTGHRNHQFSENAWESYLVFFEVLRNHYSLATGRKPIISFALTADSNDDFSAIMLSQMKNEVDFFVVSERRNVLSKSEQLDVYPSQDDFYSKNIIIDQLVDIGFPRQNIIVEATTFGMIQKGDGRVNSVGKILTYPQICSIAKSTSWEIVRRHGRSVMLLPGGTQFVSYSLEDDIREKAEHIMLRHLGGMMVSSLNEDDYRGTCNQGSFPLLRAANDVLRSREQLNLGENVLQQEPSTLLEVFAVSNNSADSPRRLDRRLCKRNGYFRDKNDCTKFYQCARPPPSSRNTAFTVVLYQCADGMVFDEEFQICSWPSWAPPCDVTNDKDGDSDNLDQGTPEERFTCPSAGYHGDSRDCRQFYYCEESGNKGLKAFEFRCPSENLGFDQELMMCNWKHLVPTCKESRGAQQKTKKPNPELESESNTNTLNTPDADIKTINDSLVNIRRTRNINKLKVHQTKAAKRNLYSTSHATTGKHAIADSFEANHRTDNHFKASEDENETDLRSRVRSSGHFGTGRSPGNPSTDSKKNLLDVHSKADLYMKVNLDGSNFGPVSSSKEEQLRNQKRLRNMFYNFIDQKSVGNLSDCISEVSLSIITPPKVNQSAYHKYLLKSSNGFKRQPLKDKNLLHQIGENGENLHHESTQPKTFTQHVPEKKEDTVKPRKHVDYNFQINVRPLTEEESGDTYYNARDKKYLGEKNMQIESMETLDANNDPEIKSAGSDETEYLTKEKQQLPLYVNVWKRDVGTLIRSQGVSGDMKISTNPETDETLNNMTTTNPEPDEQNFNSDLILNNMTTKLLGHLDIETQGLSRTKEDFNTKMTVSRNIEFDEKGSNSDGIGNSTTKEPLKDVDAVTHSLTRPQKVSSTNPKVTTRLGVDEKGNNSGEKSTYSDEKGTNSGENGPNSDEKDTNSDEKDTNSDEISNSTAKDVLKDLDAAIRDPTKPQAVSNHDPKTSTNAKSDDHDSNSDAILDNPAKKLLKNLQDVPPLLKNPNITVKSTETLLSKSKESEQESQTQDPLEINIKIETLSVTETPRKATVNDLVKKMDEVLSSHPTKNNTRDINDLYITSQFNQNMTKAVERSSLGNTSSHVNATDHLTPNFVSKITQTDENLKVQGTNTPILYKTTDNFVTKSFSLGTNERTRDVFKSTESTAEIYKTTPYSFDEKTAENVHANKPINQPSLRIPLDSQQNPQTNKVTKAADNGDINSFGLETILHSITVEPQSINSATARDVSTTKMIATSTINDAQQDGVHMTEPQSMNASFQKTNNTDTSPHSYPNTSPNMTVENVDKATENIITAIKNSTTAIDNLFSGVTTSDDTTANAADEATSARDHSIPATKRDDRLSQSQVGQTNQNDRITARMTIPVTDTTATQTKFFATSMVQTPKKETVDRKEYLTTELVPDSTEASAYRKTTPSFKTTTLIAKIGDVTNPDQINATTSSLRNKRRRQKHRGSRKPTTQPTSNLNKRTTSMGTTIPNNDRKIVHDNNLESKPDAKQEQVTGRSPETGRNSKFLKVIDPDGKWYVLPRSNSRLRNAWDREIDNKEIEPKDLNAQENFLFNHKKRFRFNVAFLNGKKSKRHPEQKIACPKEGLFAHPHDCTKYYECYWDKWLGEFTIHLFSCPMKLVYDERLYSCVNPSKYETCFNFKK